MILQVPGLRRSFREWADTACFRGQVRDLRDAQEQGFGHQTLPGQCWVSAGCPGAGLELWSWQEMGPFAGVWSSDTAWSVLGVCGVPRSHLGAVVLAGDGAPLQGCGHQTPPGQCWVSAGCPGATLELWSWQEMVPLCRGVVIRHRLVSAGCLRGAQEPPWSCGLGRRWRPSAGVWSSDTAWSVLGVCGVSRSHLGAVVVAGDGAPLQGCGHQSPPGQCWVSAGCPGAGLELCSWQEMGPSAGVWSSDTAWSVLGVCGVSRSHLGAVVVAGDGPLCRGVVIRHRLVSAGCLQGVQEPPWSCGRGRRWAPCDLGAAPCLQPLQTPQTESVAGGGGLSGRWEDFRTHWRSAEILV
ncbi:hypothetical protein NDU88_006614 [Pleurodeles waltl]|uniref:Uncharacterized protein n=1 Tax=Pleurodeles waltl TaxID=8319 RepID=A0AAV7L5V9_PLEWA|nr:hypothetical protein NDU88_006614 [Pleurodeles waltl]